MTGADPRDAVFDVSLVRSELGARTGRSARAVLITAAIKIVVALGSTALLARFVPPAEQGLVALAIPAVLIAAGLSEFGLAQAVVQRPHITHRLVTTLFWINILLGLTLGAGLALLGGPAARFYGTPEVVPVFWGLAPYVLFTVLSTQYVAILRRQLKVGQIEIGSLGSTIAASSLAVLAAWAGAGYWALVIQLVFAEAFNMIYLANRVRWWPSAPWHIDLRGARSALQFGGYLAAERLVGEFTRNMQVLVIGRVFNTADAGLFFRAQTIAQMPQRRIAAPLGGAFIPALSRLQTEPEAFRDMYVRQTSRGNLIMMPIGLVMITCADVMVRVLLGEDWLGAIPLLAWLGLLPLSAMTLRGFSWSLVACGRGRELFLFRLYTTVILLAALVIGARLDLTGLVASYMIALVFLQGGVLAWVAFRYTPLDLSAMRRALLRDTLFALVVLALMAGLRYRLDWPSLFEAVTVATVMVLCYGGLILADATMRHDVLRLLGRGR